MSSTEVCQALSPLQLAQPQEFENFSPFSLPDLFFGDIDSDSVSTEGYETKEAETIHLPGILHNRLDVSLHSLECPEALIWDLEEWCLSKPLSSFTASKGPRGESILSAKYTHHCRNFSPPQILARCLEFANNECRGGRVYTTAWFELTQKALSPCLFVQEKHVKDEAEFDATSPSFRFNFGPPLMLEVRGAECNEGAKESVLLPGNSVAVLRSTQYAAKYQDVLVGQFVGFSEYHLSVTVRAYR